MIRFFGSKEVKEKSLTCEFSREEYEELQKAMASNLGDLNEDLEINWEWAGDFILKNFNV